jgi:hypothetical protein
VGAIVGWLVFVGKDVAVPVGAGLVVVTVTVAVFVEVTKGGVTVGSGVLIEHAVKNIITNIALNNFLPILFMVKNNSIQKFLERKTKVCFVLLPSRIFFSLLNNS